MGWIYAREKKRFDEREFVIFVCLQFSVYFFLLTSIRSMACLSLCSFSK